MTFALSVSLGIMACGGSSFGGAVITATDNVGNVETIPSKGGVSIFYDVVSPTAILTPLATYQTQAPFTVEWSGSDTGSGIAGYDVEYWDGSIWQVWHTSTPLTSSGFTGNDGITYTFQVRARDNAGNVSVWSTGITTTIDAIAPESQVSAPANSQTADFEVTWSGSDATSGIVSYDVQYKDGDGAWTGWQTDTSAISATFSGQMRHSYHFQSRARDLAGHVEAWPIQPDASTSVAPLITKYYYHGGKRVAMRRGGVVQYLHGDHLGSTSLTTDESGSMVARQLYHPYGTTRYSEGTLATDFGFTGQRGVAGTGLVFMHARFYDPVLGRFVSADTIVPEPGNPQDLNRYAYVRNNPLKFRDPTGHETALPPGISQERHERLLQIRGIALSINERTQLALDDENFLSDADAMALLFDTVAPLYERRLGGYDAKGFIDDLGMVVGGVVAEGNFFEHAGNAIQGILQGIPVDQVVNQVGANAYRRIGSEDPLAQYYIGYNNFRRQADAYTGFREDIAQPGHNQVRHFFGGLVGGQTFGGLGASFQIRSEDEPYDIAMYQEAHTLNYLMKNGIVPLNRAGDYIRQHLTVDETDD